MVKFQSFEMINWDYWSRVKVPMSGDIVTLVGPNGSGKTTFVDACRTLLGIDCSKDRNYPRYLRNANAKTGWLRAVVSNPLRRKGSRAFFPEISDEVTLICRIRKSGGDWERKYAIVPGNESVEDIEASTEIQWLGVKSYQDRLHSAGISRAIRKVLALDQGETDKLCEYSGRELLRLVFETFGDQTVLNRYQTALNDYRDAEKEIAAARLQIGHEELHVAQLEQGVEKFRAWLRLKQREVDLSTEALPVARIDAAWNAWRTVAKNRREHWRSLRSERAELANLEIERRATDAAIEAVLADRQALDAKYESIQTEVEGATRSQGELTRSLRYRDELRKTADAQERGFDSAKVNEQLAALQLEDAEKRSERRRLSESEDHLTKLLAGLEQTDARIHWPYVDAFRLGLGERSIRHTVLSDLLSVRDERWQSAIEGLLGPHRGTIVLDDSCDLERAFITGQEMKYPHFITVADGPAPLASTGSLAGAVEFLGPVPRWIFEMLDRVHCVETLELGLAQADAWVTPEGYHCDPQGGRFVGAEPAAFLLGESGRKLRIAATQQSLKTTRESITIVAEALESVQSRMRVIRRLLEGTEAAKELAERTQEFAEEEAMLGDVNAKLGNLEALRATVRKERVAAQTRERNLSEKLGSLNVDNVRAKVIEVKQSWLDARKDSRERHAQIKALLTSAPKKWRAEANRTAIIQRLDCVGLTPTRIEHDIKTIANQIDAEASQHDEHVEERFRIAQADLEEKRALMLQREQMRDKTVEYVEMHRGTYIKFLKSSAGEYIKNVRTLAAMAGIEVDIKPVKIENTELSIDQAALDITFRFDAKRNFDVTAGDSSGGQKVMKSMVLLIALLLDEDNPVGIVFIDEPFAHLDIFNIDRVSSFLQKTQAQYLVTTPVTHNVNIYGPSHVTLIAHKVRPGATNAPPIGVAVRRQPTSLSEDADAS